MQVSPAVVLFGLLISYGLLVMEHSRGFRVSRVLGVFWLLASVVAILRVRTGILKFERGIKDQTYR